ncbi:MAG: hypothetical protein H0X52_06740 [Gemmatimonadetes bacterium]|jgi:hypothetical protein|nr:hypothetical protein [Gemmatimonadota bacterium]
MATLEVDINCLCLFVRDEAARTVHVLMPNTSNHHHHEADHEEAFPQHVVRMLHDSFSEEKGRPMEGWALVLGTEPGSADTMLAPSGSGGSTAEVADLTTITGGESVERRLVENSMNPEVASRITLHAGKVTKLDAEALWKLKGRSVFMAHQVVWRAENVPEELTWISLGATQSSPLRSLKELPPEANGSYRLSVYHVTPDDLPPTGVGTLEPEQVKQHFRIFYNLLGIPNPGEDLLPQMEGPFIKSFRVNCGAAQARLEA